MSGDTESAETDSTGTERGGGKRWLWVSVFVPIAVALIGSLTVAVQHWVSSQSATSQATSSVAALPPGDPIPAAWCFDCNPHLIGVARDCRDGSMHACDDLWKAVADPKVAEPQAIHDFGISCGGRRPLKSPGYQYKDCADAFPGHD